MFDLQGRPNYVVESRRLLCVRFADSCSTETTSCFAHRSCGPYRLTRTRMASERVPLLHASAILSGSSVEHRVRRLLEVAPDAPQARSRFVLPVVAMMGALVVAAGSPVLRVAYDIAEYCVRHLP